ncbi:MAG TPA: pilus assembly protein PilM [Candidatus Hypogeohydataceae bacterium YC38]|nr:pilus assembly protein PilM [Candidatus Brocadiales bacterium]
MARNEAIIGLEVTQEKMKLVEMVTSPTGLEVTNFALVNLPPGGINLWGPRLRETLKALGFKARKFNALVAYPSMESLELALPPMSKGDMKTAMAREARKDLKFPEEEVVSDYEIVGESEEKGVRRTEVLLGRANSKDIEEFLRMSKESGLRFNTFTVVPAALLNLIRMRGSTKEETLAVVHVGTSEGTVIMLHQGTIRFPRRFPLKVGGESADMTVRLVAQVKQSLLYVKQRARGLEADKIILLGELRDTETLLAAIEAETGIKTEVYIPVGLDISSLGGRVKEFRERLSELTLALGLAWNGPERSRLNLLSKEIAELRKVFLAKIGVVSVAFIMFMLLGVKYSLLWNEVKPYKGALQRLNNELNLLRPQTQDITQAEEERNLQKLRQAFLEKIKGPEIPWHEVLRTLSLCVPEEMHLLSLKVKEAEEGWTLSIQGEVIGKDAALVQKRFSEFFSLFLTCPSAAEGKVEALAINPLGGARYVEGSKLEFKVSLCVRCKEVTGAATKG